MAEPAPVRLAHSRLANAIRHNRSPAEVAAARREYERAQLAADIRRVLARHGELIRDIADRAPPLTEEQRAALALLVNQAGES